jgi:hypothetical protein
MLFTALAYGFFGGLGAVFAFALVWTGIDAIKFSFFRSQKSANQEAAQLMRERNQIDELILIECRKANVFRDRIAKSLERDSNEGNA